MYSIKSLLGAFKNPFDIVLTLNAVAAFPTVSWPRIEGNYSYRNIVAIVLKAIQLFRKRKHTFYCVNTNILEA